MDTIYNLQSRADELRKKTETESISAEMVGGLHADTLDYVADLERNLDGLGIRKIYKTYAAMTAEGEAPTGTNGKALRYGQLVTVYDGANTAQAESGNIYAWQTGTGTDAWLLVGNLGNIVDYDALITSMVTAETAARKEADAALQAAVDAANLALENAKLSIGQRIGTVETRVGDVESKTTATEAQLNTLQTTVEGHGNEIETLNTFMGSKDEPNGIAPLDDDSQVPETNLPESVFGVLPFDMVVEGETSGGALSGEKGDGVAYDTVAQCFYAYEQPDKSGPPTRYYKYWLNGTRYGDDSNNRKPYGDKIYLNTATNTLYQWNGSSLVAISSKQVALTQSAYDALVSAGAIDEETYYNILEE